MNGKEFHDYFSKFGNIISAKLVEDDEGEVLGYGFVLYDNLESSSTAVSDGNGAIWKDKPIYVGKFEKNRPKKAPKFNTVYVKCNKYRPFLVTKFHGLKLGIHSMG